VPPVHDLRVGHDHPEDQPLADRVEQEHSITDEDAGDLSTGSDGDRVVPIEDDEWGSPRDLTYGGRGRWDHGGTGLSTRTFLGALSPNPTTRYGERGRTTAIHPPKPPRSDKDKAGTRESAEQRPEDTEAGGPTRTGRRGRVRGGRRRYGMP
jgi:hypothetical protein